MDPITTINHSTTRPKRKTEEERLQRRLEHREDQLRKSRRFTALVGIAGLIAGMAFQAIISAPPVWIDHMPTTVTETYPIEITTPEWPHLANKETQQ